MALFEVVAVDEDDRTIEIQHFDGTVEEFEVDAWNELPLVEVQPPEDWSGSVDMDREDYETNSNSDTIPETDWSDALDFLDRAE